MFTITDIRNIAIQIEKNGEECYRNAGRVAKNPEVAKMLNWMADEEKHHAQWFETIQSSRPFTPQDEEMEAMGKSLLQEMVKGNTFLLSQSELERAETVMEVLTRSKEFEQDTILFYEFLQGLLNDPETVEQLQRIIEEERNHLRRLELVVKSEQNKSRDALTS